MSCVGANISKSYSSILTIVSRPFFIVLIDSILVRTRLSSSSVFSSSGNFEINLQMVGSTFALISSESFRKWFSTVTKNYRSSFSSIFSISRISITSLKLAAIVVRKLMSTSL